MSPQTGEGSVTAIKVSAPKVGNAMDAAEAVDPFQCLEDEDAEVEMLPPERNG